MFTFPTWDIVMLGDMVGMKMHALAITMSANETLMLYVPHVLTLRLLVNT